MPCLHTSLFDYQSLHVLSRSMTLLCRVFCFAIIYVVDTKSPYTHPYLHPPVERYLFVGDTSLALRLRKPEMLTAKITGLFDMGCLAMQSSAFFLTASRANMCKMTA